MENTNEIKNRITKIAENQFLKFGFTKVTMDEIAGELGMSKKTLYKYFTNKKSILREIISNYKCQEHEKICCLLDNREMDFIVKVKTMMGYIAKHLQKLRGPLLEDLRKNIPDIWTEIEEIRKENIQKKFSALVKEGVEKGFFRADDSQKIVVLTYLHSIQGLINPVILTQLPFTANQVFETIISIMFKGILTDEGRKKYNSIPKNEIEGEL